MRLSRPELSHVPSHALASLKSRQFLKRLRHLDKPGEVRAAIEPEPKGQRSHAEVIVQLTENTYVVPPIHPDSSAPCAILMTGRQIITFKTGFPYLPESILP